jgi:hypothetical protein
VKNKRRQKGRTERLNKFSKSHMGNLKIGILSTTAHVLNSCPMPPSFGSRTKVYGESYVK